MGSFSVDGCVCVGGRTIKSREAEQGPGSRVIKCCRRAAKAEEDCKCTRIAGNTPAPAAIFGATFQGSSPYLRFREDWNVGEAEVGDVGILCSGKAGSVRKGEPRPTHCRTVAGREVSKDYKPRAQEFECM